MKRARAHVTYEHFLKQCCLSASDWCPFQPFTPEVSAYPRYMSSRMSCNYTCMSAYTPGASFRHMGVTNIGLVQSPFLLPLGTYTRPFTKEKYIFYHSCLNVRAMCETLPCAAHWHGGKTKRNSANGKHHVLKANN